VLRTGSQPPVRPFFTHTIFMPLTSSGCIILARMQSSKLKNSEIAGGGVQAERPRAEAAIIEHR